MKKKKEEIQLQYNINVPKSVEEVEEVVPDTFTPPPLLIMVLGILIGLLFANAIGVFIECNQLKALRVKVNLQDDVMQTLASRQNIAYHYVNEDERTIPAHVEFEELNKSHARMINGEIIFFEDF